MLHLTLLKTHNMFGSNEKKAPPNQWTKIWSSPHLYKIQIAQDVLREAEIESIVINKQDSAYLFGEIELYALKDDALRASNIIQNIKYS